MYVEQGRAERNSWVRSGEKSQGVVTISVNHHRKLWGTLEVGVGLVRVTGTEGKGDFHGEATLGEGVNPEDPGIVGPKLFCPIPIDPKTMVRRII